MLRRDRRELAFLGTLLLGWGFAAAPVLHQVLQHETPTSLGGQRALPLNGHGGHSHTPGPAGKPGAGTLEHLLAAFVSSAPGLTLLLLLVALERPEQVFPARVQLEVVGGTAMPQGP